MIYLFEAYLTMLAVAGLIVAVLLIPAALLILVHEGFRSLVTLLPWPQAVERPVNHAVAPARPDLVGARD